MGKIAFVFPGQGAQYPGMGKALAECSPAAAEIFRKAETLRPGTMEQCFSGTAQELQQTAITQPCLYTVETATAAALTESGITPHMVAGFSLGELSALNFAEVVDWSTCFSLVCRRGELMQAAAEAVETAMVAVVRLGNDAVEQICSGFTQVYPVNYNCPGQVTVALRKDLLTGFSQKVKAAGGRALPLKVGGGFHSPFMDSAARQFGEILADVQFVRPGLPLYANCTGLPYGEEIKATLSRQICSPVRWEESVRHMIASGADTFIEVGPGNVLSGLIGRIDPAVRTFCVSDKETLDQCIREVKVC